MPGFGSTAPPPPSLMSLPAPAPVNPALTNQFNFALGGGPGKGGGAGAAGISGLKSVAQGMDFGQIAQALIQANAFQTKEGVANIEEAFGSSGMRFSSDLGRAIGDFTQNSTNQVNAELVRLGVQEQGVQLAGASQLAGLFANQAGQFYPTATVVGGGTPGPGWGGAAIGAGAQLGSTALTLYALTAAGML